MTTPKPKLMPCEGCDWKYPDDLLSPFTEGELVCGICALSLKNMIHGTKDKKFTGKLDEENRLAAINWRKEHKHDNG